MNRDFNQEEDEEEERSGRPSPEEVDRFVEAVLGRKPTPTDPEVKAREDRKFLEWAAKISTTHEQELRDLERKEEAERKSANLSRWVDSVMGVEEAQWDPSQHPRAPKGESDGGQWVATGGSGSGASGVPVTGASYSGPKHVVAQQVSAPSSVGHHWVPVGVVFNEEIRPLLSDEAVEYAIGAYSGGTDPSHMNATYGGVKHPLYSDKVKTELQAFIERNKIKKMTASQMEEFVGLMKKGVSASGGAHSEIGAFNRAIKGMVPKGTAAPSKMEDILAAGRKYMKHSRFQMLAAGAVLSGLLSEVVAKQVNVLDVAAESGHYQHAMQALQDGDLAKAHLLLTGDRDSLYIEIVVQIGAIAALNFKDAMDKAFENARKRVYK